MNHLRDKTVLLVSDYGADPATWLAALAKYDDRVSFRTWPDTGDPTDVVVILIDTTMTSRGGFAQFTNLQWVSYLGHGAGDVLGDPSLDSKVKVTRLRDQQLADGIKLCALNWAVSHHQRVMEFRESQQERRWERFECKPLKDFVVGVLGVGFIGKQVALLLRDSGFSVLTWSRSPIEIDRITCLHSPAGLDLILSGSDFIVSVLPETEKTKGLFNAVRFAKFKRGAALANLGRGSLINETDLLQIGRAHV